MLTPKGTAIMAATKIIIKLPRRALAMPPPDSPTGFGRLVKKLQSMAATPCLKI